ncbi:hypothetical protein ALC57_14402 [Trachymyrmex cornetzi]|uniref:Uncharacterized protein n=1 Tax=Trachymyrmex cornetzi TaxID=471704 RepID=A0A195DLM1_9HYME|nr:hypothetical protein ALC57_14402 [Trachymyrmex cornetzi]
MYPGGRNSFHRAGQFTPDPTPPTPPACSDYGHQPATRDLGNAAPNFASQAGSPSSPLHFRRFSRSYRTRFTLNGYSPKRNLRPNEFTSDGALIRCTTRSMKGLLRGVCRLSRAKRSTGEKSRKSGAAVGAFIAYGSAKHLWNNGAAKYIVGEEKRKYLARERTRKIGFYCSAAGVPVVHMHVRYTYTLKRKIDTFSVSIRALVIVTKPAETERKKCTSFLRDTSFTDLNGFFERYYRINTNK